MADAKSITVRLPAQPASARDARKVLARLDALDGDRLDDALLALTELVTNSVRHGGLGHADEIEISLVLDAQRLRAMVCDTGRGFDLGEVQRMRRRLNEGGYGLQIVGALTDRWGVSRGDRTCVWFEIDRSPTEKASPQRESGSSIT